MSSAKMYAVENTALTDMVNHESMAGARLQLGDVWGNEVLLGVFNGGAEDDHRTAPGGWLRAQVSDLPQMNGDWGCQVKVLRDLWKAEAGREWLGADLRTVRAGVYWFHAQDHRDRGTAGLDTNFEEFTDVFLVNSEFQGAGWGAFTDFVFANVDAARDDDTDIRGVIFMPYWDLSEKWQIVFRYMKMWGGYGEEDRLAGRGAGVDLETRMRTDGFMGEGDALASEYLGLNYFICGHNLKLQFGAERYELEDSRSEAPAHGSGTWSYQSAVRLFF